MVVKYLEKIRDRYLQEKIDVNTKLNEYMCSEKETIEFISLLEKEDDSNLEEFTPRIKNDFNKMKIEELEEKRRILEKNIEDLEIHLVWLENELEEVSKVIRAAKRKK